VWLRLREQRAIERQAAKDVRAAERRAVQDARRDERRDRVSR
jgi:hypothetical protein